jgi:hypothetical protein
LGSRIEEQERRIAKIFGQRKVPMSNQTTLRKYLDFLKRELEQPCQVTGIEDFPWEERYVMGFGNKAEYERLKKTRPSYTDIYELVSLNEEIDDHYGLLARVKRLSDKKSFELPLADLEATEEDSKNYQLLDDFSVWFVNWR